MKNKLLVTTAALAFAAGTGLAIAQGTMSQTPSAAPSAAETKQPAATDEQKQAPATKKGAQQKGTDGQAQKGTESQAQPKGSEGTQKNQAQDKGATQDKGTVQKNQAQDKGAAQDKGQAAQKSDSAPSASLSVEQRTRVREVIVKQGNAPRVTNVNFSLSVGTVVPRTVRVVALPGPVIEIYPSWRGYLYFMVGDQIVVVEPGSLRIVAVISA
jgi:hypothetical protein